MLDINGFISGFISFPEFDTTGHDFARKLFRASVERLHVTFPPFVREGQGG
jgi:hypothetical protein